MQDIRVSDHSPKTQGNTIRYALITIALIVVLLLAGYAILTMVQRLNMGNGKEEYVPTSDNIHTQAAEPQIPEADNNPSAAATATPSSLPVTPVVTDTVLPTVLPTEGGNIFYLYFFKGPLSSGQAADTAVPVVREKPEEENIVPYAVASFFNGPTAEEREQGLLLPFTFTGDSNCGGSTYRYSYNVPRLKVTLCKEVMPLTAPGESPTGLVPRARVLKSITESLKVDRITAVEVIDRNGNCYAEDTGLNNCE